MANVFDDNQHAYAEATEAVDKLAAEVSGRTDLSEDICRQLLINGWKFTQELGKPDRWEKVY